MSVDGSKSPAAVLGDDPVEVFCDTNILINYLNQEWESQQGAQFVEADAILIVISEQVQTEIDRLVERRQNLYQDLVQFLLERDDRIEEFSTSEYIQENDYRHLHQLQMELTSEDPAEVLMRLREFSSKYSQRAAGLLDEHVHEVVLTAAPFLFEMALDDVIPNSSDTAIVAGAADWTSQGGSGILLTNDASDIVDRRDKINSVIEDNLDADSTLLIWRPGDIDLAVVEER